MQEGWNLEIARQIHRRAIKGYAVLWNQSTPEITGITYQGLLAAVEETKSEYGESKSVARSKGATVGEGASISEMKEKIETLTLVVKSSNVMSKPPGSPAKPKFKTQKKDNTVPQNSPAKGKKNGPNGTGLAKSNNKPMQCYNCGGWGMGGEIAQQQWEM